MNEKMLATVAVQLFNERALKVSLECAICGSTFESRLIEDTREPALRCSNGCTDRWYTRDADGTFRERPSDERGELLTE